MLAFLRRLFVGSWLGRILALLIFLSFAAWGVGDFVTGLGRGVSAGNVASVGGRQIGIDEFQRTYQRALAAAARSENASDPMALPYGEKRQAAGQALQQLMFQALIDQAAHRTGVLVPDAVVRNEILKEKAFAGPDGRFSRAAFDQRLQAAGMGEDQLIRIFREQQAALALIEPLRVGAVAPAGLVRRAFDYGAEQRVLDVAAVPFGAAPALPDEATLKRYYDNHKDDFRAPEYRRVRVVVLSPDTVARGTDVSEADERKLYGEMAAKYQVPEHRSVRVLIAPDQAAAATLAARWRAGASWEALQADPSKPTPIALDDTALAGIPSPDLARLVFAAPAGSVQGPDKTDAGWVVLEVSKVTPAANRSFEQARDELHDIIARQRAAAGMSERVQKLQDAIAGGGLDSIPGDLGAAAAEGTLDAQGNTPDGEPAPLPGSDAVRGAILQRSFATAKGAAPDLQPGPENSWIAVAVENVTPAAARSFEQARAKVGEAWQADARRKDAETRAAALLHQADTAGGLARVVPAVSGLRGGIAVRRGEELDGVPAALVQIAFGTRTGGSTMVQSPDGFVVATVTAARHPTPEEDPRGFARARAALDAATADDVENSYVSALRARAHPDIDAKVLDQVVGPAGGAGGGGPDSGS
ncbi:MAG: SurA N-terminal domain-containing protein [Gluconacetobacter diazotrophicus]|nr:SurA N-terminal domain-containing protein [Gluconacetobacter diazotrophicus]